MPYRMKDVCRGLVLASIIKSKETNLSLIEYGGLESKQVMEVNAAVYLYFKHSSLLKTQKGRWQFVFSADNIRQIRELASTKGKTLALALICCPRIFKAEKTEIAFIPPEELKKVLHLDVAKQQIIYIDCPPKGKLTVTGPKNGDEPQKLKVSRNDIKNWNP